MLEYVNNIILSHFCYKHMYNQKCKQSTQNSPPAFTRIKKFQLLMYMIGFSLAFQMQKFVCLLLILKKKKINSEFFNSYVHIKVLKSDLNTQYNCKERHSNFVHA